MTQVSSAYLTRNPQLVPIMDYIREHPGCTAAEIRLALGRDVIGADTMRCLHSNGLIRRSGHVKNCAKWVVM